MYCIKKPDILIRQKTSHSYGVSLAIWYHTVLPATRHKWTHPTWTPAREADTRFTYPGGMDTGYIPRWFTRPQMVTHPSTNPAVHGQESNSQPVDHKSDALTTTLPSHLNTSIHCLFLKPTSIMTTFTYKTLATGQPAYLLYQSAHSNVILNIPFCCCF